MTPEHKNDDDLKRDPLPEGEREPTDAERRAELHRRWEAERLEAAALIAAMPKANQPEGDPAGGKVFAYGAPGVPGYRGEPSGEGLENSILKTKPAGRELRSDKVFQGAEQISAPGSSGSPPPARNSIAAAPGDQQRTADAGGSGINTVRKKRPLAQYFLMGMVLLLVGLAAALTTMRFAIHGREVIVPKLVGMKLNEAQRAAEAYGLSVVIEDHFYSSEVPQGGIVSQLPAAGSLVRRGWQIRAAQSLGAQGATVPSVVGQSPRVAEIIIQRSGLDLGEIASIHVPDAPPDQVLAQDPPPESKNLTSPKVSLLVPAGPEPKAFVMPYLLGRRFSEVHDEISQAGLKIGRVVDLAAPVAPPAMVFPGEPAGMSPGAAAPGSPAAGSAAAGSPSPDSTPAGAPRQATSGTPAAPAENPVPVLPSTPLEAINPLAVVVHQSPGPGQKIMATGTIYLDVSSKFATDNVYEPKPEDPQPPETKPR